MLNKRLNKYIIIVTKTCLMVHKANSSQTNVIKGILDDDPKTIANIYRENFGRISSMVNNFHNISLDADDVFQDGLTRAIINIRKGIFKGDSTFSTYLYSICRNICLKEYNKEKGIYKTSIIDTAEEVTEDNFASIQIMLKLKNKLKPECRHIIDLRFGIGLNVSNQAELRFDTIAKKMNIMPDNARQKFKRCMSKLLDLVKQTSLMENYQIIK